MATYFRLLDVGRQFFDSNGDPLNGGKLYTYEAGTTTNKTTYQDDAGASSHANPIILDSAGRVTAEVWGTTGAYKLKLDNSSDSNIWTRDDIVGVNDTAETSASEWVASGLTPTYVSATSFTFAGDQTTIFHAGRRLRTTDTGGTDYSTVITSTYSDPSTTITVLVDSSGSLDSGLSAVSYGLISKTNPSYTATVQPATQATTSGNTKTFSNIPSWVTQIDVMLTGVSLSGGTDGINLRIGDSGGLETSGYSGGARNNDGSTNAVFSGAFNVTASAAVAALLWSGLLHLRLLDAATNTWAYSGRIAVHSTGAVNDGAGSKALSGTLTQVALLVGGTPTDAFDAGSVSIQYR